MTKKDAENIHQIICDTLNPNKINQNGVIMAFTYANAHGLYVLDGIARQVLYSGKEECDISIYIGNLLTKDYFAAKASFEAMDEGGEK